MLTSVRPHKPRYLKTHIPIGRPTCTHTYGSYSCACIVVGLLLDVAPPNKPEEKSTEGAKIPPLLLLMCVVLATMALVGIALYLRRKISGPVHVI